MAKKRVASKLKGIGGWLLFFVILFSVDLVWSVIGVIIPLSKGISFNWVLSLIYIIITAIILFLIVKQKKNAPKRIIILLVVCLIIMIVSWILEYSSFISIAGKTIAIVSLVIGIIIELAFVIILILYFKKSVRVKNTYTH